MSEIINPNDSPISTPFDPYWDKPMSRREVLAALNKLINNQNALMTYVDTSAIALNFLLEKFNVTREELDEWVKQAALKVATLNAIEVAKENNGESNQ